MAAFADRLRKARERRKLTTRDLAKLASVDHTWISRLETGERQNVSLQVALRLAQALDVSLDWLVARHGWGSAEGKPHTQIRQEGGDSE